MKLHVGINPPPDQRFLWVTDDSVAKEVIDTCREHLVELSVENTKGAVDSADIVLHCLYEQRWPGHIRISDSSPVAAELYELVEANAPWTTSVEIVDHKTKNSKRLGVGSKLEIGDKLEPFEVPRDGSSDKPSEGR